MRAALAILALWLGAGCDDGVAQCGVDQLIESDVGFAENIAPCGEFTRGSDLYTDAAMNSAQACVLNAIRRKQGFRLAYDANDADNAATPGLRAGWTGTLEQGRLVLRTYAGTGDPAQPARMDFASTRLCEEIVATPDCTPTVGRPCLTCTGEALGNISCRI